MLRKHRRHLELHREVVKHLRRDPDRVIEIGKSNIPWIRNGVRGDPGNLWIDEWERLLDGPVEDIIRTCISEGEWFTDMRQVGPFAGVLSQEDRMIAIRRVSGHP